MKLITALFIIFTGFSLYGQVYFPPVDSDEWEILDLESLNWCQDSIDNLYTYLETNQTKAFILLKDGKIVLEKYFDNFEKSDQWYWASAGKTVTASLIGIAQGNNHLNIDDLTSIHLGEEWTSCPLEKENLITIKHQLSMSSGLDDLTSDQDCTDSSCLHYKADAGRRWAYHNAPYTLLGKVLEEATSNTLNHYVEEQLLSPIGMDGKYIDFNYNKVFTSTARSMARFGLLVLNHGDWDGNPVISDKEYMLEMLMPSQDINKSYGYLWWLNGQESYMLPQSQIVFSGSLFPDAPTDLVAAMGKNGQFVNVVPSEGLVWIRMGNAPTDVNVPYQMNNEIWQFINSLKCGMVSTDQNEKVLAPLFYPNPATSHITIDNISSPCEYLIYDSQGVLHMSGQYGGAIDISMLGNGTYFLCWKVDGKENCGRMIIAK